ncbi:OmpW family protein [Tropicimonas sp. IMCC6043]|uniref:OmpW/AlkL family protein n=1 Tax=Tropicimonas sp. IMCC6043 TaxID=2510645 RepID=UPI00101C4501|nr:OmpW family outer membrane protein [Tropicimonas sp. IMCC6043]RYH09218.1 OmpW family protein [Tropicimonas sp. IMCC6043]
MFTSRIAICTAISMLALAGTASAQSAGEWTLGFGAAYSMPKYDNGYFDPDNTSSNQTVTVSDTASLTFTGEYFIWDNVGVELLVPLPFSHSADVEDYGKAVDLTYFAPTLSLQYHFRASEQISYLIGLGVNYSTFTDVSTSGDLKGLDLDVDNSFGGALHLGLDYWMSDDSAIRADMRWISIDTDADAGGSRVGEIEVDPFILGLSYIRKF